MTSIRGLRSIDVGSDNSIIFPPSPSRPSHATPRETGETHRIANEPRVAYRFHEHPLSPLHLSNNASSDYDRGKRGWGARRLPILDQEYYDTRRAVLLGLHKSGFTIRRAHLPFREASLPTCKRQASTRARTRPESGLEHQAGKGRNWTI
jgi:hypothetical protein